jgi:hypothetical protein
MEAKAANASEIEITGWVGWVIMNLTLPAPTTFAESKRSEVVCAPSRR